MVPCRKIATLEPSPAITPVSTGAGPAKNVCLTLRAAPLLGSGKSVEYSTGGKKMSRTVSLTLSAPLGIMGV